MIKKINGAIDSAKNIAIFFHINPDGDAIGSSLALKFALTKMGKNVDVYSQDKIEENYSLIDAQKHIITEITNKQYDLGIVVDCPELKRIGTMSKVFGNCKTSMNIDHHLNNSNFADIVLSKPTASSTCEIIFELFKKLKIDFTEEIYKCLYTGLITDSGCFMYNLTDNLYKFAGECCKHINAEEINFHFLREKSLSQLKLYALGLSSIEVHFNNFLATIVISNRDLKASNTSYDDTSGLVYLFGGLKGVKVVALLCEEKLGEYKVSFRSREVDVCKIAEIFGGGGHKFASGCKIYGTKNTAKKVLLNKIETYLKG